MCVSVRFGAIERQSSCRNYTTLLIVRLLCVVEDHCTACIPVRVLLTTETAARDKTIGIQRLMDLAATRILF